MMETGSRAKKAGPGRPKKTTLREDRMLKRVVQQHRFQSLGAVNRMWKERISKVARRNPLIGPNNRYAIKYDGTKFLVGMCKSYILMIYDIVRIRCFFSGACRRNACTGMCLS